MAARKAITNEPLTVRQKHLAATCVRMAWHQAIRMGWKHNLQPAEIDDLGQRACEGVCRASKDYDEQRGTQFTTYASTWIKHFMSLHMKDRSLVRHPTFIADLRSKYGDIHPRTGKSLPPIVSAWGGSTDEEDEVDFFAELPAETEPDWVELDDLREWLFTAFEQLTPLQREVLCLRFGFLGEPLTMIQIGQKIGRTRERARQLEAEALVKLRSVLKDVLHE